MAVDSQRARQQWTLMVCAICVVVGFLYIQLFFVPPTPVPRRIGARRNAKPRPEARDINLRVEDDQPVDLVYMWVNGSDPAWYAEHEEYRRREGSAVDPGAVGAARYAENDELRCRMQASVEHCRYSLRSVMHYGADLRVRNVIIVTNKQRPSWLPHNSRTRIVDHSEIFTNTVPTFNSNAILANLHRIPGVSETFLLMHDDFFFAEEHHGRDVFVDNQNQRPLFYCYYHHDRCGDPYSCSVARANELLDEAFGPSVRNSVHHTPQMMNRRLLALLERTWPTEYARTIGNRFRSRDDVNVMQLYAWYAMESGLAAQCRSVDSFSKLARSISLDQTDTSRGSVAGWTWSELANLSYPLLNFNDGAEPLPEFRSFLQHRFPWRSSFELEAG